MLATELPEDATEAWKQDLSDRIEEIIDRKKSSAQGRETTLNVYTHYLMSHYAFDQIQHKVTEILPALLKSIKSDNTEKETCLASRGSRDMKSCPCHLVDHLL
jgi:Interferon-related developmental regulator (IFRD)